MRFLHLHSHHGGTPVYINTDTIVSVSAGLYANSGTEVVTVNHGDEDAPYRVTETPEEILAMIPLTVLPI